MTRIGGSPLPATVLFLIAPAVAAYRRPAFTQSVLSSFIAATRPVAITRPRGVVMRAKNPVLWISLLVIALFAGLGLTRAQTGAEPDVVTAISDLETDAVKADLAGDPAFYRRVLAEDWTRGDSDGTYYTKADLLKLMADTKNIKTNSEKLSELKVRAYGSTAVATYKDTYDILIKGEHRAHTIIATDTFVKIGGEWKQVASHGSEAK